MSDAARQNLKVSREGIVLIKSFEGFRPRAIQRAEGGWIIGYGHTLSAREGATVSEADAELLLRYDLLPVEASVNDTVPSGLNQHQFDALASFAFSVGVDRFAGSDVRQRLNAGAPGEAADAIMGWPEPPLPDTALRRRAAERALFVANPLAPVALSDLLSAPLPPPPVPVQAKEPDVEPVVEAEPVTPEPLKAEPGVAASEPEAEVAAPVDPRGAAVAALLGEPPARLVEDEAPQAPIIPSFAPTAPAVSVETPAPSNDNPPIADIVVDAEPVAEPSTSDDSQDAHLPPVEPVQDATSASEDTDKTPVVDALSAEEPSADKVVAEDSADADGPEEPVPAPVAGWSASRYAPYSLSMVGPLPYLQPATTHAGSDTPAIDHAVFEVAPESVEEQAEQPAEVIAAETPVGSAEEFIQPEIEVTPIQVDEPAVIEAVSIAEPELPTPVEPMAYVAPVPVAPVAELVLTPLEDAPEPAFARPLWTPEERDAPDGSETNLFGEDLTLTLGGSVMRHEMEFEAPAKFDWKETAPFIFMGGVGLVSFGASMAAFRRAAEQSGGSELTIIGWVLALIGLGCVGVSSINLYRKFGLPGGD